MILYAALAVSAVLAALLVVRYDLYEREPLPMLLVMGGAGALVMRVAGWSERVMLDRFSDPGLATISLVAATHEEALRLGLVALFAAVAAGQFNDPIDGLIYGSIVGLGMAVMESVDHMDYVPELPAALPPTEVVRLMGHLVLGGITCYGLGLAKLRIPRWGWWLAGSVAFSTVLHFLWDWIAFTSWVSGLMPWWQTTAAIALMLGGLLVYGVLVILGSDHSRRVFAPRSTRELWGWPFSLWRGRAPTFPVE
jgi:RsiW-degrading membrane proteinase PrsW (M82 family)